MQLIENKSHCVLEYDPALQCVVQTWKGFARSSDFRQSILKTIEFFQTHAGMRGIISNTQESEVVSEKDADWVAQEANPLLVKHGLQKIAFILPKSVLAKWSVDHFMQEVETIPAMQYFDNLEAAKAWIEK